MSSHLPPTRGFVIFYSCTWHDRCFPICSLTKKLKECSDFCVGTVVWIEPGYLNACEGFY